MKKFFATCWAVLKYILVYFASSILIDILISVLYIIGIFQAPESLTLREYMIKNIFTITFYVSAFSLTIFMLMVKFSHKNINKFLRFKKISLKNINLLICEAIIFCMLSICVTEVLIRYFPSYHQTTNTISMSLNSFFSLACVVVLLPIFEEIFFRGIIFNELRSRINLPLSVVLQALIFGLFHGNMVQGLYTFALAIILSLAYIWTDTLWAPIIIHIFFNLLGSFILPPLLFITSNYFFIYITSGIILAPYIIYLLYITNSGTEHKSIK